MQARSRAPEPGPPEIAAFRGDASLRRSLRGAGLSVESVESEEELIRRCSKRAAFEVVLLVAAPLGVFEAITLCRELRAKSDVPVLMLGPPDGDETDAVVSFEVGADGYMREPLGERELVSRVRALLRRRRMDRDTSQRWSLEFPGLAIDLLRRRVLVRGKDVILTATEFELLLLLARAPGRVYGRGEIMSHLWDGDFFGETRAADVHVQHLRRKIEADPAEPHYIQTVRGVGYRFAAG